MLHLNLLRPLKVMMMIKQLKNIVKSLAKSFIGIINVWVLMLLIWLVFAIVGMYLYQNKFGYC